VARYWPCPFATEYDSEMTGWSRGDCVYTMHPGLSSHGWTVRPSH